MSDYTMFLASKRVTAPPSGIDVPSEALHPRLFDYQRDITRWALARGRAAIFSACGTGKTIMQLEFARHVHAAINRDVLILAPLAVAAQTRDEAADKLDLAVTVCRAQADVRSGINITNYEMLEHFDPAHFGGIVLDESSILRNFSGTTRKKLTAAFAHTPYRLCCTATPAPNDHTEIGQHAEFLGIMPANEMLSRWFINDTMAFGTWRLKRHAEGPFWEWVASWAVALERPSDLGYADDGFNLPPLNLHELIVPVDRTVDTDGRLFRIPELNATELHREMRRTAPARAAAVAELVNGSSETWAVWCNTNYEADELTARIPDAIEVRGSERPQDKERKLRAFSRGESRVIVSKPTVAGYGLNWQHCHHTAFVGLSYSFEQLFQALRRLYRFGQSELVDAYIVVAETEEQVLATVKRKMVAHERQYEQMRASTHRQTLNDDLRLAAYRPETPMRLPGWLRTDWEAA